MKLKNTILLAAILIFSACSVVSLHPLYTSDTLVMNEDILGSWTSGSETWEFSKQDANSYELVYTDLESSINKTVTSSTFAAHLVKLGEDYYLDLLSNFDCDVTFLEAFSVIPAHLIMKLEFTEEALVLSTMSSDWLEELLAHNKLRIKHEVLDRGDEDQSWVITASTEELQKFITKYGDSPEAFEDPTELVRL